MTADDKYNGTKTKKSVWNNMTCCLPPRRGMMSGGGPQRDNSGQYLSTSTTNGPDLITSCSNKSDSSFQKKKSFKESGIEPTAPSPGSLLFNDEEQSDVVLLVGPEPKMWRFPGHSFILATASPVFQAMFGSGVVPCSDNWVVPNNESSYQQTKSTFCKPMEALKVDIPDIDPCVFQNLLRFVYMREIHIQSVQDAMNIFNAANKYMIFDLIYVCLDYLNSNLNPNNALSIYKCLSPCIKSSNGIETCHDSDNLQNELLTRCLNTIDSYAEQILKQDDFGNLESVMLHDILSRNTLQVRSEMSIFDAIMMWACQECKRQRKKLIPCNKMEVLGKTVFSVRYLLMTPNEFISGPYSSGLLSVEERDIFLKIIQGEDKKASLPFHLLNKNLDVKRTCVSNKIQPNNPRLFSSPRPVAVTCHRNHNANGNIRKKTVSKRFLQGLGDFIICFIQILD